MKLKLFLESPLRLWTASGACRCEGNVPSVLIKEQYSACSETCIYGLMALCVIAFSITSVTFDLLVGDDLAFYQLASESEWGFIGFKRMLVAPVINHYLAELMVISPTLARLAVLFLGMVPVSILAYIVFTRVLSLPRTVAFFSALLPHILPAQQQVPTYVIGSYMTWGLLFYFMAVLSSSAYLKGRKLVYLVSAVLFYLAAVETTEVAIFLTVPLFLLILGKHSIRRESLILIGSISIAAGYKAIYAVLNPFGKITSPQAFDLSVVLDRVAKGVYYAFPNPGLEMSSYLPAFLLAFTAVSLLAVLAFPPQLEGDAAAPRPDLSRDRKILVFAYSFGFVWLISSFIPFSVSYNFPPRYVYVAGFGLNLLLVLALYSFIGRLSLRGLNMALPAMMVLALLVGLHRIDGLDKIFSVREEAHVKLRTLLLSFDFPKAAQIVVVGPSTRYFYTWGAWPKSTGYLRYTLKRDDISGQVGPQMAFYNPFERNSRGWDHTMCGLSPEDPLFMFRYDGTHLTLYSYCLAWERDGSSEKWTLFQADPIGGGISPYRSGRGKADYDVALEELAKSGISQQEILWASEDEFLKKRSLRKRLKGLTVNDRGM